nr:aminodeoxychorismate/anthranilate synthase component II [uncultured Agathobaculum sp.]
MVLLIDNYDSFSYNLYQQAAAIKPDVRVARNDALTISEVEALSPSHILLSPGPGRPKGAGICEEVIRRLGSSIPILGVCLGHQAVCEAFGGSIVHAKRLMHGKQSVAKIDPAEPLFSGLPRSMLVARYHSLAVSPDSLPDCLIVTARDEEGEIMAVRHRQYPVYGVQFHPESILTPQGNLIMQNFLSIHHCQEVD